MGQKVHPVGFRLAVTRGWDGSWFAGKNRYKHLLKEDVQIREFLLLKLKNALIGRLEIDRNRDEVKLTIHSAKPGMVIGRAGSGIEEINKELKKKFFAGRRVKLSVNVKEIQKPSLSARVIGMQVAADLEKRMPYRRVMKGAIERVLKANAEGVKIKLAGRLNGADIARAETLSKGKIPLHTLRADIDYSNFATFRCLWTKCSGSTN